MWLIRKQEKGGKIQPFLLSHSVIFFLLGLLRVFKLTCPFPPRSANTHHYGQFPGASNYSETTWNDSWVLVCLISNQSFILRSSFCFI